jgi:hypothetical protein
VGLTIGFSMSKKNQISKVGFATLPNNKLLGGGIRLGQQLPNFICP